MSRCYAAVMIALAAMLLSCNWMPGPMDAKCEETRVQDYPAPGGKLKAVEYHNVCEGQAYVATVEVAGGNNDRATAMHARLQGKPDTPLWPILSVAWKSDSELWVTYPEGVDVTCVSSPPGVTVHCIDGEVAAGLARE